ncbi:hypothetical protein LNKW23_16210 [Paralimibaculum aggregatum]|uniref:DUF4175 domain-containing protein n=1 Tax=Paralimibaculum aggregatum TaxID=3036245 RepID=A0ABQ6LMF3_9RHOB|nr:hypothetical protein [Limibaculum sp. NKW23]GMG82408.1 hypothetical protein LNKW23_16210 [Limibaculum sp. NKW23]
MPPIYKILVTCFIVGAIFAAHVFRDVTGLGAPLWLLVGLVVVMVIGLWIFPEPKKEDLKKR